MIEKNKEKLFEKWTPFIRMGYNTMQLFDKYVSYSDVEILNDLKKVCYWCNIESCMRYFFIVVMREEYLSGNYRLDKVRRQFIAECEDVLQIYVNFEHNRGIAPFETFIDYANDDIATEGFATYFSQTY